MKTFLSFLFILFGAQAYSQQGNFSLNNSTKVPKMEYGSFEKYAFVVDGTIIQQRKLVDYPRAKLNKIVSFTIKIEGQEYPGALYFHTGKHPVPSVLYANDPAYFVNGTQVSPNNIRWSRPEAYNRIEKSKRDTIIEGVRYKGSIHVDTDEDFFAERIALPKLIEKYSNILPIKDVIIYWHQPSSRDVGVSDVGMVIHDRFPIYYINPTSIRSMEISAIRFAEGERYIVRLIDEWYPSGSDTSDKWRNQIKVQKIFEYPLAVDTACPCYVSDFDTKDTNVFQLTELKPEPYRGKGIYLQKLSEIMGLPAKKSAVSTVQDSISIQFIVTKIGMLTRLESTVSDKPGHAQILQAIKRHSCPWSPGMFSGRPVLTKRKMTIMYSKDQNGNIQSLDTLEYRYDDK